ncbi:MAG: hypothetical protein GXP08_08065 [Gammaproteobacteria bacterium]|nr:hypothetical protein [Gammaproteobacteria bacterium]
MKATTFNPIKWLGNKVIQWLIHEDDPVGTPPCDFDRLSFKIRPCDVLLVEGRSRVSDVIKTITQSVWTHSALYIGRLVDIEDMNVREHVSWLYDGDPEDQLIIEPLLGKGTIISPLKKYANDHLRVCRPTGLSRADAQNVIKNATDHLGQDYDVRQLIDLGRFIFPYGILPRRWRSSLFEHNAGESTRTVCSTMIANAFTKVHFPILPVIQKTENGLLFFKRNTRLFTPSDFDYSPYFEIIKYPLLGLNDLAPYKHIPWDKEGVICNDENDCFVAPISPHPSNTPEKTALNNLKTTVNTTAETESNHSRQDEIVDIDTDAPANSKQTTAAGKN